MVYNLWYTVLSSLQYYLTLDEATTLNLRLKLKGASFVSATVDGEAAAVTHLSGDTWQLSLSGIAANNLGKPWHVVVTADSKTACDLTLSALSYVHAVLGTGRSQAGEAEALTALYDYYVAAKAYSGK